ncbi:MAG: hypothetical protein DRJ05_19095, partial [Bacteroidetes bacterium]
MKLFFTILFFFIISLLGIQEVRADGDEIPKKVSISGNITDKETGEDLIGATVFVQEIENGTSSNVYGFYSISLERGSYTLIFSYVGYQ